MVAQMPKTTKKWITVQRVKRQGVFAVQRVKQCLDM
jgi:hypothetical protein